MRKSDVIIRSKNPNGWYGEGVPAIDVKNHLWVPDLIRKYRTEGHDFSGDEAFWSWVEARYDESDYDFTYRADEMARESCWELAQEYALEVWPEMTGRMVDEKKYFPDFPPGCQYRFTGEKVWKPEPVAKVYSDGRSGGWLVVHGLPDVETWDAIALGRWAKFNKMIRDLVDEGYPYDFVWHLHVNVYEPYVETFSRLGAVS
jgi:hypothetical protein